MDLKDLRRKKGVTQRELAELVGVSPSLISCWEIGKYPIAVSLVNLNLMLKELNCSFDELVEAQLNTLADAEGKDKALLLEPETRSFWGVEVNIYNHPDCGQRITQRDASIALGYEPSWLLAISSQNIPQFQKLKRAGYSGETVLVNTRTRPAGTISVEDFEVLVRYLAQNGKRKSDLLEAYLSGNSPPQAR